MQWLALLWVVLTLPNYVLAWSRLWVQRTVWTLPWVFTAAYVLRWSCWHVLELGTHQGMMVTQ
jgi:hypothetical protein